MSYIHGIEIKTVGSSSTITAVDSSIVGLVGIAAKGTTGKPVLITSLLQAKQEFGEDVAGTTIISAVTSIFEDGGGTACLVVNVADSAKIDPLINSTGANAGKMKLIGGKYASQVYEVAPATGAGLADFTSDVVSGFDLIIQGESLYGYKAKVLLAPGFSQVPAVLAKMRTIAGKLRAKALVDIVADSVNSALTARAGAYSTSDNRVILCYPRVTVYNEYESANVNVGLSQMIASALVSRDNNDGFWVSPSNLEIPSVLATEVAMSASLDDATADTNLLNSKGIVTVFRTVGTGFRIWGNWTSAFPTEAKLENMISASRVKDVLDESVQKNSLSKMDGNITLAMADSIANDVNQFISTLKTKGALFDGNCEFDVNKNPSTELAIGRMVFTITFSPTPSLDNLTFESIVDSTLLKF